MRKEADQFTDSTFLEGMTSIRALIHAKDAGVNDRPIEVIYYDSADKTRERDLTYLRAKSMEYRYRHMGVLSLNVVRVPCPDSPILWQPYIRTASMRSLTALRIPIISVMLYVLYTRVAQTASFLMSEIG